MFTGIIQSVGSIAGIDSTGGDARMRVRAGGLPLSEVKPGDSIAVNGVCLTAVELAGESFAADVSAETLARTTLGTLKPGARVNLELALLPTTRLGGHLVSGHVDGVGRLVDRRTAARSQCLQFETPPELARYVAAKGSVCVDGVSLTVNTVAGSLFEVNIVPHTLDHTTLCGLKAGDGVNIEVDLVARYLERLLQGEAVGEEPAKSTVTRDLLARHGFLK